VLPNGRLDVQRFASSRRPSGVIAAVDIRPVGDALAKESSSRAIVEDVHAGNGQTLFGFARRLGLRDDEAEDVVQEALLRLWRQLSERSAVEAPVAWTFRTAYRLAMDRHRARRRWLALLQRGQPWAGEREAATDDLVAVWAEVDALPTRQRAVLYLRYRADLTFDAIGEVLGIDAGSARSNAARGIATIRRRLGRMTE
jgi:RNA polymerase sigma factor (sigma-70 family)